MKDELFVMSHNKVPKTQRALVFQGGGALAAYDTGVFKALYEKVGKKERFDRLFDIVAGTSSGAMNGAILVSHVVENRLGHNSMFSFCQFPLIVWYKASLAVSDVLVKNDQIHPKKAGRNKYFRIHLN
jgi:predicted acylesterase/phospholipase RssA